MRSLLRRFSLVRFYLLRFDVWLVGLGALLLYAATAAPGIVELFDDSLEFQTVAPTFAIAHPTGYPLYTLLGGLWSRVLFPLGNWAWRMNLFSGLAGAAAVALVYLLGVRLAGGKRMAGLIAALAFGLGPVWWSQTTVAEVYALHGLFVAGLLYAAIVLPRAPGSRQMLLLWGLAGLSLTHHRTAALLLPSLALYLLWSRPSLGRPQARWLGWLVALLIPLLLYLYIPLRAAMGATDLEGDYTNSWTGFWRHVLASGYTGFFADNPLAAGRSAAEWLLLTVDQLGWVGLGLGVFGLVAGLVRREARADWALVLVTLLANLLFAANYRVADVEVFWLPVFFCLALGTGHGAGLLAEWAGRLSGRRVGPDWGRGLVTALLLLAVALGLGGRGGPVDRSADWDAHVYALALAGIDFPPQSRVVGLRGQMTALEYMQASRGMAANARAVALDDPDARRAYVTEAVAAGLPVYITQEIGGIEESYSFSGEGALVRVWPRGQISPLQPQHLLDLSLAGNELLLRGYDLRVSDLPGGPWLETAFYWQPQTRLPQRLKLSLRLLAGDGTILRAEDRYPLRLVAPTTAWLPGETLRDVHLLALHAQARQLLVIVYDEATLAEAGQFTLPLP